MKTDDGIKIHAIINTDELRWTETMEGERERERDQKKDGCSLKEESGCREVKRWIQTEEKRGGRQREDEECRQRKDEG